MVLLLALLVAYVLGCAWGQNLESPVEGILFTTVAGMIATLGADRLGAEFLLAFGVGLALGIGTTWLVVPRWEEALSGRLHAWGEEHGHVLPGAAGLRDLRRLHRAVRDLGPDAAEVLVTLCRDAGRSTLREVEEYAAVAKRLAT